MNTYNTASAPGAGKSGGVSIGTVLVVVGVLCVAGYLVHKYVIKPAQEKEQAQES